MPRPHEKIEKSKDFKGSIKKIFISLKPWHMFILFSIILAMASAIISLVTPRTLSTLTDYITEGLKPRVDKSIIVEIMNSNEITMQEKQQMMELFKDVDQNTDSQKLLEIMDKLPPKIYDKIKPKMNFNAI